VPVCDAVWHDGARRRDVPVRISLPAGAAKVPLVVWSPGLGGEIGSGGVWARSWRDAGLAVVQMQHPGSDGAVYRGTMDAEARRARIAAATSPEQVMARVGDARFVLSEIGRRPRAGACDLARIDTARVAIAGHSMGAWVVQAIAGQRFGPEPSLRDLRFRAAVALSPTAPPGTDAFARIGIPFLSITGSRDGVPDKASPEQAATALAWRSAAYHSLPADGGKCLLVIGDAAHMMLAGNRPADAANAVASHAERLTSLATRAFLVAALAERPNPLAERLNPLPTALPPVLRPGDRLACK
jgi:predicted dienelactone hydrolase